MARTRGTTNPRATTPSAVVSKGKADGVEGDSAKKRVRASLKKTSAAPSELNAKTSSPSRIFHAGCVGER